MLFHNCSVLYLFSLELQGVATSTRVLWIAASPVRGFALRHLFGIPGFSGDFPPQIVRDHGEMVEINHHETSRQ